MEPADRLAHLARQRSPFIEVAIVLNDLSGDKSCGRLERLARSQSTKVAEDGNSCHARPVTPDICRAKCSRKAGEPGNATCQKRVLVQSTVQNTDDRCLRIGRQNAWGIRQVHPDQIKGLEIGTGGRSI